MPSRAATTAPVRPTFCVFNSAAPTGSQQRCKQRGADHHAPIVIIVMPFGPAATLTPSRRQRSGLHRRQHRPLTLVVLTSGGSEHRPQPTALGLGCGGAPPVVSPLQAWWASRLLLPVAVHSISKYCRCGHYALNKIWKHTPGGDPPPLANPAKSSIDWMLCRSTFRPGTVRLEGLQGVRQLQ